MTKRLELDENWVQLTDIGTDTTIVNVGSSEIEFFNGTTPVNEEGTPLKPRYNSSKFNLESISNSVVLLDIDKDVYVRGKKSTGSVITYEEV